MGPSKQRLPRDAQTEIRLNQIARQKTPTDWKEEEGFEKRGGHLGIVSLPYPR